MRAVIRPPNPFVRCTHCAKHERYACRGGGPPGTPAFNASNQFTEISIGGAPLALRNARLVHNPSAPGGVLGWFGVATEDGLYAVRCGGRTPKPGHQSGHQSVHQSVHQAMHGR